MAVKREKIAGALTAEEVAEIKRWVASLRAPTQGVFDFTRSGSVRGHSSQTTKEGRKPKPKRSARFGGCRGFDAFLAS